MKTFSFSSFYSYSQDVADEGGQEGKEEEEEKDLIEEIERDLVVASTQCSKKVEHSSTHISVNYL